MKHRSFSVEELLADESFQQWVLGDASSELRSYWDQWISESDDHRKTAESARQIIASLKMARQEPPAELIDDEWERLKARLEAEQSVSSAYPRLYRIRSLARWRAAAVIVVLMAASALIHGYLTAQWPSGKTTLETGPGERATVELPDGSMVVLNANSSLTYGRKNDKRGVRYATLHGEAYFDIRKSPEMKDPIFEVETLLGSIQVLGTQFTVASWDDGMRVTLTEGRVKVSVLSEGLLRDTTLSESGQMIELEAENRIMRLRHVNPDVYSSWRGHTLLFDDTPFHEIVSRLKHTYGYTVQVTDHSLLDVSITGAVQNDQQVLLEGLSRLIDRPISVSEDRVVID